MGVRGWLLGIAAAALLTGCAAAKAYKDGQRLELAGKPAQAASRYLDALDARPAHPDALVALDGVAEEAWLAKLEQAQDAEGRRDYVGARDRYKELVRLEERLDSHGFLEFDRSVDAKAKVREMEEGAAERAYTMAEKQRAAGQYESAIAGYREAQGFVAGYRDTAAKIGASLLDWAGADAAAGRYRVAWERYLEASRAGAVEGNVHAAEIAAALGRWHLAKGSCRQAVRDLAEAERLAPGAVRTDYDQAWACAEQRVAVTVEPRSAREVARLGFDPAARLEPGLVQGLPEATSDFVVLVDASALDGAARDAQGRLAVTRVLGARALSWDLEAFGPTERERRARAEADVECVDEATGERRTCVHAFDLLYTEVTEGKVASLSVAATIVSAADAKVLASKTFDLGARADVAWAEDLRDAATGQPAWPTYPGASAVRLPDEVAGLVGANRTLTSDARLFDQVGADVAFAIVEWAAGTLDAEPSVADPTELRIQPLPGLLPR